MTVMPLVSQNYAVLRIPRASCRDYSAPMVLSTQLGTVIKVPYALRRIPAATQVSLLPFAGDPRAGDIALARVEKIGKNTAVELADGRRCGLHEADLLAVVFGNRYASRQFEGYAGAVGDCCDLLSMGGLCGVAKSKHASLADPTKLRILYTIGDCAQQPLQLGNFAVPQTRAVDRPRVVGVCGTSMDSGKTHTAMSLIKGLGRQNCRVAGIKLTGTAAGRDTWTMRDAGAFLALDFVDGGLASTFMCALPELLNLHKLLVNHAASQGAEWVVIEVADGLLQRETAALLQNTRFAESVDSWVFAASEALSAVGGVALLRSWGIRPLAMSGLLSMSPLDMREAELATGLECLTATQLQTGHLNARLSETVAQPPRSYRPAQPEMVQSAYNSR